MNFYIDNHIMNFSKAKRLLVIAIALFSLASAEASGLVTVDNGRFMLDGRPYRYVGTNFWYGPILGSTGPGGDRQRLETELDSLQAIGIDNLRVLAGGDGDRTIENHIEPTLQIQPGIYDPYTLEGLDYFLSRLEERGMRAVIYLNNSWEWSGGGGGGYTIPAS